MLALLVQTQCSRVRLQCQLPAHRMRKRPRNLVAMKRCRGQLLRKLSLRVASLAINPGQLVSPAQEGEMNELFVKRKSSQA
jgi:hypothetical protein